MSLGKMSAEEKEAVKSAKAEAAAIAKAARAEVARQKKLSAKIARKRAPKLSPSERAEARAAKAAAKAEATGDTAKAQALKEKAEVIAAGKGALRAAIRRAPMPTKSNVGCKAAKGGFCFDLKAATGEKLKPLPATAPAIAMQTRKGGRSFNYFANNLVDVCRVKKIAPKCFTPTTNDAEKPREMAAWGKNGKFPDAKTEEQKRKACDAVGGSFNDGGAMPLRLGKTELDFLSAAQAKSIGAQFRSAGGGMNVPIKAGPNLRLCFTGSSKGAMVPLKDPKEAVKVRNDFRECLASHGANPSDAAARACAISVGRKATGIGKGQETALFGVRRKKSRKARR